MKRASPKARKSLFGNTKMIDIDRWKISRFRNWQGGKFLLFSRAVLTALLFKWGEIFGWSLTNSLKLRLFVGDLSEGSTLIGQYRVITWLRGEILAIGKWHGRFPLGTTRTALHEAKYWLPCSYFLGFLLLFPTLGSNSYFFLLFCDFYLILALKMQFLGEKFFLPRFTRHNLLYIMH